MSLRDPDPGFDPGTAAAATAWVVRHERGLTAVEQDAFSAWLAADPRHRAAFAEQRWSWEELDRLNGLQTSVYAVPEETRPTALRFAAPLTLAGIALVAAIVYLGFNRPTATEPAVAKDPARPFVVEVDGVTVRAVGTALKVKRGADSVAVLVPEGTVALNSAATTNAEHAPLVTAGQKAIVSLSPQAVATVIEAVAAAEMEVRLAWKPRLLEFDEAPLAEIAAEFNPRNPVRIEIASSALRTRRLSATLRSDNVEGFVRMLESEFGIAASSSCGPAGEPSAEHLSHGPPVTHSRLKRAATMSEPFS